ncbi:MAG: inositol monophosphatase family protein [Nocardioidaceae bacterium]
MTDAGKTADDLAALLDVAVTVAERAAALVRARRPTGRVDVATTKSSPTDAVTEVDTASEALIRGLLGQVRPQDGIVGEEGADHRGTTGVDWVVDPIDGTVNFMYGVPVYAVSIAAVRAGRTLAGVVLNVPTGERFSAVLGGGAWVTQAAGYPVRLTVPAGPPLARALVATGFGYDADRRRAQGAAVATLLPQVRDIRRLGSAALDLCSLAAGRYDAYVEQGLKPWDLAAGGLVVTEAGARLGGHAGGPAGERLVVAAGPELFDEFAALVASCGF